MDPKALGAQMVAELTDEEKRKVRMVSASSLMYRVAERLDAQAPRLWGTRHVADALDEIERLCREEE